jgi:hypothetical protein
MSTHAPPKQKRRLCRTALRKLRLLGAYRLLSLLQAPFGSAFWFIEQRIATLQDRFDNERSGT